MFIGKWASLNGMSNPSQITVFTMCSDTINCNNLMTCASKLKVNRGIPSEPILYLSGKHHISEFKSIQLYSCGASWYFQKRTISLNVLYLSRNLGRRKLRLSYCLAILQRGFHFCSRMKYSSHTSHDLDYFKPGKRSDWWQWLTFIGISILVESIRRVKTVVVSLHLHQECSLGSLNLFPFSILTHFVDCIWRTFRY